MNTLSRTERKRQRTHQALIDATRKLAGSSGLENVSVQEITELADVGLGTFYNYFQHKEAVFDAVLAELQRDFDEHLEKLRTNLKDPAMRIAAILKFTLEQAMLNEEWYLFCKHSTTMRGEILHQQQEQFEADLLAGVKAGRFRIGEVGFTCNLITGMLRHIILEMQKGTMPAVQANESVRSILRMLGLTDMIARALSQNPLPAASAPKRTPLPEIINWDR
jgi:AcrR family transcriptional regulator